MKAYLLGGINFIFQYLPLLIDKPEYQFLLNIIIAIIIMPITLFVFNKHTMEILRISLTVCVFYLFTAIIANDILISVFKYEILFYDNNLLNEFIINIVLKICQFILLIFVGGIYEKFYIKSCKKSKK